MFIEGFEKEIKDKLRSLPQEQLLMFMVLNGYFLAIKKETMQADLIYYNNKKQSITVISGNGVDKVWFYDIYINVNDIISYIYNTRKYQC